MIVWPWIREFVNISLCSDKVSSEVNVNTFLWLPSAREFFDNLTYIYFVVLSTTADDTDVRYDSD